MKTKINLFIVFLIIVGVAGCSKVKEKVDEKVNEQVQKTSEEVNKQLKEADSLKSAGEQMDKETKVNDALEEEKILNDTKGQWAIDAEASSTYGNPSDDYNSSWLPLKLIGPPDVQRYSDDGNAWAPKEADKGIEWIKVTFPKAVNANEIRIRQSYGPGTIIKIELVDDKGKSNTVWEGVDKNKYEPDKIKYFVISFAQTTYKTKVAKITLATNSVQGWNEIDAVQLVGE
jgi:hypothetical protein